MRWKLDNATSAGYKQVESDAIADSSSLPNPGDARPGDFAKRLDRTPTDQRISAAKNSSADVQLVTLVFNYGPHLPVGPSCKVGNGKSLPNKLQEIWNNSTSPLGAANIPSTST